MEVRPIVIPRVIRTIISYSALVSARGCGLEGDHKVCRPQDQRRAIGFRVDFNVGGQPTFDQGGQVRSRFGKKNESLQFQ